MKTSLLKSSKKINFKLQDSDYNISYQEWLSNRRISMGVHETPEGDALTYTDGVGFIEDESEGFEKRSLTTAQNALMIGVVVMILVELVCGRFLPTFYSLIGIEIQYDSFNENYLGNDYAILSIIFIKETLKYLSGFLVIRNLLNIPLNIILPTKIADKEMFKISLPTVLLAMPTLIVFCMISAEIFRSIGVQSTTLQNQQFITTGSKISYLIILIFYIPLINELILRGLVIQSLRQFGDSFAIIVTAFISVLTMHDLTQGVYIFLSSILIGYFTIVTGSMITSYLMKVSLRAITLLFAYLFSLPTSGVKFIAIGGLTGLCIILGLVFLIKLIWQRRRSNCLLDNRTSLNMDAKLRCILSCPTTILTVAVAVAVMAVSLRFW